MQSGRLMCTSASLLRGSRLSASACTQARLPCASSGSFRVYTVVLACRHLRPSPAAYLAPCPPSSLLGQSHLRLSRLGQRPRPPLFSPVSLACRRLHPGPPATIAIAKKYVTVSEKTDHLAPMYGPKALQMSRSRNFTVSMPRCTRHLS